LRRLCDPQGEADFESALSLRIPGQRPACFALNFRMKLRAAASSISGRRHHDDDLGRHEQA
jgi:hypothetical protein